MAGVPGMPIILIVLFGCFALSLTVSIIVIVLARRRGPRVTQASCGHCRYPVEGLTTMTCPECGSDLREVGIITPARGTLPGPFVWVVLWTLLLPFPALFIGRLVYVVAPSSWNNERYVTLQPREAGTFSQVDVTIWAHGVTKPQVFEWASVELRDDDRAIGDAFVVNLENWRWRIDEEDAAPLSTGPATADDVAMWMSRTLESDSPQPYDGLAEALLGHIASAAALQSVTVGEHFATVRINAVGSQRRARWVTPSAWAFWIAVWLIGIWLIMRRARRASRPMDQERPGVRKIASNSG